MSGEEQSPQGKERILYLTMVLDCPDPDGPGILREIRAEIPGFEVKKLGPPDILRVELMVHTVIEQVITLGTGTGVIFEGSRYEKQDE